MTGYLSSNMDYMIEILNMVKEVCVKSGMKPAAHQEK